MIMLELSAWSKFPIGFYLLESILGFWPTRIWNNNKAKWQLASHLFRISYTHKKWAFPRDFRCTPQTKHPNFLGQFSGRDVGNELRLPLCVITRVSLKTTQKLDDKLYDVVTFDHPTLLPKKSRIDVITVLNSWVTIEAILDWLMRAQRSLRMKYVKMSFDFGFGCYALSFAEILRWQVFEILHFFVMITKIPAVAIYPISDAFRSLLIFLFDTLPIGEFSLMYSFSSQVSILSFQTVHPSTSCQPFGYQYWPRPTWKPFRILHFTRQAHNLLLWWLRD